jgi:transcriptional regulator with XRE-family HTH domain
MSKFRLRDYDDEKLILAIAAGRKGYGEIAKELGVSRALVTHVAHGRCRRDLQPRIRAAGRLFRRLEQVRATELARRLKRPAVERLARLIARGSKAPVGTQRKAAVDILKLAYGDPARSDRAVMARPEPDPPPPGPPRRVPRRKQYDDDALVEALVRGEKTQAEIARDLGLHPNMVNFINTGRCRPDLQPRLQAARRAIRLEAGLLLGELIPRAMGVLAEIVANRRPATANQQRLAAVDIIRFMVGKQPLSEWKPGRGKAQTTTTKAQTSSKAQNGANHRGHRGEGGKKRHQPRRARRNSKRR